MKPRGLLGCSLAVFAACTQPPQPARTQSLSDPPARRAPQAKAPTPIKFDVGAGPGVTKVPDPPPEALLCQAICEQRQQAKAVSADAISRECQATCQDVDERPSPPKDCLEHAAGARKHIESVAMQRRAPRVWVALSKPDLHCGYEDAFLRALAGASTRDLDARNAALSKALRVDPYQAILCPRGSEVLDQIENEGIDVFVAAERCGISAEQTKREAHRDVSPQEFLAYRAVQLRWEALGLATSSTHRILLNILLLSSALERDNAR